MSKWDILALMVVAGIGAVGFLRVVANEIFAVERRLGLLVAEERARRAREEQRAEAA